MKVECPDAPHLHTFEEAAFLLRTSVEALRSAISHGRLPKPAHRGRMSDEEIAAIVAGQKPAVEVAPARTAPRRSRRTGLTALPGGQTLKPEPGRARSKRRRSA